MAYIWDTGVTKGQLIEAIDLNNLMSMIDTQIINYTCSSVNSSVNATYNSSVTENLGGTGYSPIYRGKYSGG